MVRQIFIQTKQTPNPNFLKFIPTGKIVLSEGTKDYTAPRFAYESPLALKLFQIEGVCRVFYGHNFISVAKKENEDWNILKPQIFSIIMDQFVNDLPIFTEQPVNEDTKFDENDSEAVACIKEIINSRVRPSVQDDGGDIIFKSFDEQIGVNLHLLELVKVVMKGACTNCPSSQVTLKNGIERMLKHYVPQVNEVEAEDFKNAE